MMGGDEVRQLLDKLAAHPVLPSTDRLPPNDEALHVLLADLAAGERSRYANVLCDIATEHGITPRELAQRAEFLLEKGAIDLIVDRRQARDQIAALLAKLCVRPALS